MDILPPDIGSDLALLFAKLRVHDSCMQVVDALFEVDVIKEFVRCFLERREPRESPGGMDIPLGTIPCVSRAC